MLVIFQKKIPFYRKELFEKLSFEKPIKIFLLNKPKFKVNLSPDSLIHVIRNKKIFNFYIFNYFYFLLAKDKVFILEADLRFTPLFILLILLKKKIYLWGVWETNNYLGNFLRKLLVKFSYGTIFYSTSQLNFYSSIKSKNSILARNTLYVNRKITVQSYDVSIDERDSFLFVGSLVKRKKIDLLINSWKFIIRNKEIKSNLKLRIIGDGAELNNLKNLVKLNDLNDSVIFLGNIDNENELKKYYFKSFASCCLGQSGLSIVQSLLFGVPFVCLKECHSGGEKENIINGETGFLCKDSSEFTLRLKELSIKKYPYIYRKSADFALRKLMISDMIKALSISDN